MTHAVVVSLSEDPDIVRDLVHHEEDLAENAAGVSSDPLACVRRAVWGMLYADDAGIVSNSAEGLAKMMTVIVTVVFEAAGLTVSEKTETMLLRTPDQAPCTSPLVIEAAGQRYRQTTQVLYLGSFIDASAHIMPDIKRWVLLAWAYYSRFKQELYDIEAAPFALKMRMLKALGVMKTLLYGCVTWNLGNEHFAELRTAYHRFLLRIIGFQRRLRTDHLMSYAKAIEKAPVSYTHLTLPTICSV